MSTAVQHAPAQNRYLLTEDGKEVGLIDYTVSGSDIHLTHSEIDPTRRGQGLGAIMAQGVLDSIRTDTDYRVVAECSFVADWLQKHPDYQELEAR